MAADTAGAADALGVKPPMMPTIGSFTPLGLTPKFRPSRLISTPSTVLAATPSSPASESWKPLPLGALLIFFLLRWIYRRRRAP